MSAPRSLPGIAVVGCGAWGRNHVRALAALGALRAVCDIHVSRARAAAEAGGAVAAAFDDLLADDGIAGIVVATPDATHARLARAALEAGKHVLVEKPMATAAADAAALARLAEDRGRVLMVGHILHYHPAFLRLRDMVAEGAIGPLRHLSSKRLHLLRGAPRHALWDLAPHDVSMALALAGGPPAAVRAQATAFTEDGLPRAVTLALDFEDGLGADIAVSGLHPVKLHQFAAAGDDGFAVFEDSRPWAEKLGLWRPGLAGAAAGTVPAPEPVAVAEAEPLRAEAQAFLDAIAGGPAPPSAAPEGLAVVRVIAAAARALDTGTAVELDRTLSAALQT